MGRVPSEIDRERSLEEAKQCPIRWRRSRKGEANRIATQNALNELDSKISAAGGDGAQLILDAFAKDGIVGSESYQLDVDNYDGGSAITVGRRPTPNLALQEVDLSIAFATYGGNRQRVTLTGDVELDASGVLSGLPKTIYIAIPSDGTPQIYEDPDLPNLLYIYSMCWTGTTLTTFVRMAHILPGYQTLADIASAPQRLQVFDGESCFLSDVNGKIDLELPGAAVDNGISIKGAVEILGFAVRSHRADADGVYAPTGDAPDNQITFEIRDNDDRRWNDEDVVLDGSATPETVYAGVDDDEVGTDRFVTEYRSFRLVATLIGSAIVSARALTLTIFVRPLIGTAIPKDSTKVDSI